MEGDEMDFAELLDFVRGIPKSKVTTTTCSPIIRFQTIFHLQISPLNALQEMFCRGEELGSEMPKVKQHKAEIIIRTLNLRPYHTFGELVSFSEMCEAVLGDGHPLTQVRHAITHRLFNHCS